LYHRLFGICHFKYLLPVKTFDRFILKKVVLNTSQSEEDQKQGGMIMTEYKQPVLTILAIFATAYILTLIG